MIEIFVAVRFEKCLGSASIPADRTPVNPTTTDEKALEGVSEGMRKFFDDHAMAVLTDEEYEKNTLATAKFLRKYLGPKTN